MGVPGPVRVSVSDISLFTRLLYGGDGAGFVRHTDSGRPESSVRKSNQLYIGINSYG
jgi:hypothetical protein